MFCGETNFKRFKLSDSEQGDRVTLGHDTVLLTIRYWELDVGFPPHCAIHIKNPSAGNYHNPTRFNLELHCF